MKHARRLRPDTRLGPWLYTVARNLHVSYIRSRLLEDSAAGLTRREIAERRGVHVDTVSRIRTRKQLHTRGAPARGSSVFAWSPA